MFPGASAATGRWSPARMIPQPGLSFDSLLLQAVGILPLAALSFLLSRSIQRDSLRAFWQAWASLAAALFSFYLALRLPAARPALEPLYFFGEYVFAASILAGGCGAPV